MDLRRTILLLAVLFIVAVLFAVSSYLPASDETSSTATTAAASHFSASDSVATSPSSPFSGSKDQQNQNNIIYTHAPFEKSIDSSSSATELPSSSGGVVWRELGRVGWARPVRQRGETHWTCRAAREELSRVYEVASRSINFNSRPKFGMTWWFHDPYPVCGSILLRHIHGSVDNAPVLRVDGAAQKKLVDKIINNNAAAAGGGDEGKRHSNKNKHAAAVVLPSLATAQRELQQVIGSADVETEVIDVVAGEENSHLLSIEDCGERRGFSQLMYTARLVSHNFIAAARITPREQNATSTSFSRAVSFVAPAPGLYVLEVKLVHANGTSDNPAVPRSLGVVGIRANINNRKAFMYNTQCDYQRHVLGSPILVRAHELSSSNKKSFSISATFLSSSASSNVESCTRADYEHGFWVRIANPRLCAKMAGNPFCTGDSEWVSDASAYNTGYVWVPSEKSSPLLPACKYHYWSPPQGPARTCLRHGDSRAFLYLVGDSVMREYAKNCELVNLRSAKLQCLYANIRLEGQHFSNSYAESVAKVIVTNVRENNVGVFATNLGLQHMIGPCTTKQWKIFVRYFVLFWKQQIVWAKGATPAAAAAAAAPSAEADIIDGETVQLSEKKSQAREEEKLQQFYYDTKFIKTKGEHPKLEQAIWIGPPQIQYARKGMGAERAALWDEIAWKELQPLGFQRMRTIPITQARQEGTWDGLHYASERNKVQTEWRNKAARVYKWSGGISTVLMTVLLNMICHR